MSIILKTFSYFENLFSIYGAKLQKSNKRKQSLTIINKSHKIYLPIIQFLNFDINVFNCWLFWFRGYSQLICFQKCSNVMLLFTFAAAFIFVFFKGGDEDSSSVFFRLALAISSCRIFLFLDFSSAHLSDRDSFNAAL